MMLHAANLIQQLQWIELRDDLLKSSFDLAGDCFGRQQSCAWGLRRMIALQDARSRSDLLFEFEGWLEEVHKQARGAVQARKRLDCAGPFESVISDKSTDHCRVLLLDPSLVVFMVRPRSRELDALRGAVSQEGLIEELTAVVDVNAGEAERQAAAQGVDRFNNEATFPNQQGQTLGPTGCDVGQGQRMHEAAGGDIPTVGDQVDLHEARHGLVPVGECPDRHALAERSRNPANSAAPADRSYFP